MKDERVLQRWTKIIAPRLAELQPTEDDLNRMIVLDLELSSGKITDAEWDRQASRLLDELIQRVIERHEPSIDSGTMLRYWMWLAKYSKAAGIEQDPPFSGFLAVVMRVVMAGNTAYMRRLFETEPPYDIRTVVLLFSELLPIPESHWPAGMHEAVEVALAR